MFLMIISKNLQASERKLKFYAVYLKLGYIVIQANFNTFF